MSWQPAIDKEYDVQDPFAPETFSKDSFDGFIDGVILGHNTEEGLDEMSQFINNAALYANFTATLPKILFGRKADEICDSTEKTIIATLKRYIFCICSIIILANVC